VCGLPLAKLQHGANIRDPHLEHLGDLLRLQAVLVVVEDGGDGRVPLSRGSPERLPGTISTALHCSRSIWGSSMSCSNIGRQPLREVECLVR
jgi:hypothetical protein